MPKLLLRPDGMILGAGEYDPAEAHRDAVSVEPWAPPDVVAPAVRPSEPPVSAVVERVSIFP